MRGQLRRAPVVSTAFLLACFSLAGLPLLAGFPARQVLLEAIAAQSISISFWVLAGSLGFLLNALRSLTMLAGGDPAPWQRSETRTQLLMLVVGVLALVMIGIFPGLFLPRFLDLLLPFIHLR